MTFTYNIVICGGSGRGGGGGSGGTMTIANGCSYKKTGFVYYIVD